MLKGLIAYLRSPEEGKPFDCKPKSILSSFWLYLVAVFFITLLMGILVSALGRTFPTLMRPKIVGHSDSPVWIVALLGPILEEGAFRLSLNRIVCMPGVHQSEYGGMRTLSGRESAERAAHTDWCVLPLLSACRTSGEQ